MERLEGEPPPGQTGVRDGQAGQVHDLVSVKEQIEVDGARAVAGTVAANATQPALDRQKPVEELAGRELGLDRGRTVQKPGLVGVPANREWSAYRRTGSGRSG